MILHKHRDNTDVAIEVLKSFYIKENNTYSLKVAWYRVSAARNLVLYPMGITQKIKVPRGVWRQEWRKFPNDT